MEDVPWAEEWRKRKCWWANQDKGRGWGNDAGDHRPGLKLSTVLALPHRL